MGYFSELDLKIRQHHPRYYEYELPECEKCGGVNHIIAFTPPNRFRLSCRTCHRQTNIIKERAWLETA